MSNYDPKKPSSRPHTPTPSTAWFEFLLDENLLEKHLKQSNADPSPGALITIFLHQANVAANIAKDIVPVSISTVEEGGNSTCPSKRTKALRLLALKTAAFMKWNLNTLDSSVPLPMVFHVLLEFLMLTLPKPFDPASSHTDLDFSQLPEHALFALQLYHRWVLRTVVQDSFPSKPTKVPTVQIPGLLDANAAAGAREPILNVARNTVADSLVVLERLLQLQKDLIMPLFHCFGVLSETTDEAIHEWDRGKTVTAGDLRCQVCYDLGCLYFMKEDYGNARNMFNEVKKGLEKVWDDVMDIDVACMDGYLAACHMVPDETLYGRIQSAKAQNSQDIPQLLLEDNNKEELNLQYRVALEDELRTNPNFPSDVLFRVECCNAVYRLRHNVSVPPQFLQQISEAKADRVMFLGQVMKSAISTGNFPLKATVKKFVWFLCLRFPDKPVLLQTLTPLLTPSEQEALAQQQTEVTLPPCQPPEKIPLPKDASVELLESQLRSSTDPEEIKTLLKTLMKSLSQGQILHLTDKWRLPRELYMQIEKQVRGFDAIYLNILIGNGKLATFLQQYHTAKMQLRAADFTVKDKTFTLSRLICYEMLHVELTEFEKTGKLPGDTNRDELLKKTKACLTSMQHDQSLQPPFEVIASCAAFLLSMGEWEYILSVNNNARHPQLAKLLAAVSKELPNMKTARKPSRTLWEAVILIFTSSQQQKRKGSNVTTPVQREGQMGLLMQADFCGFIKKILEPVTLSVLISCLTRLYNRVQNDISCDISSDYVILWPTALGSSDSLYVEGVAEAMTVAMSQALWYNPANPSWLRTQADIHLAHSQYSEALKFYLKSGQVTTDCFSDPVPEAVYSDDVYKRMIKCCSYLQCHTQVAVLCQFLKEPDYVTAFKALQERSTYDATDVYYECFWDITMLEYLINLHCRRGEHEKKQAVLKLIGQPELNSSNPAEIQSEASKYRKMRFLRAMAKQYA